MAGEVQMTVCGNLVGDPELRYTPSGHAVAQFTVAQSERVYDRESGEFKDGRVVFMRCQVWRDYAENVAASLTKGARVVAVGHLIQENYETKDGQKRTGYTLEVLDVGPALRFAQADVRRMTKVQAA